MKSAAVDVLPRTAEALDAYVYGESLVYFDGDLLATLRDPAGRLLLCTWCAIEARPDGEPANVWMVAPITPEAVTELRAGRLPLRDTFADAPAVGIVHAKPSASWAVDTYTVVARADIPEDYLAEPGACLSVEGHVDPP